MKTIEEMAREAGGYLAELPKGDAWLFDKEERLEAFAELVRADEREACAKACDDLYRAWTLEADEDEIEPPDAIDCKLAIQARENT
jgi:hypothetical protein